jgi:hypothetical protein
MKRFTTTVAWICGAALAVGILSCTGEKPPSGLATQRHSLAVDAYCCDTMYVYVSCSKCEKFNTSAFTQNLTSHSMFLAASVDSCACGPDTIALKVVGMDSMIVTKSGSWLTAYFSAPTPIVDSISVGDGINVVFRKI